MNKRMVTMAAGGALVGAALVGIPTLAMAGQDIPAAEPTSSPSPGAQETGSMMSDPELMDQMKNIMSEMMADEDMREQMRSMMSDVMGDMGMGMDSGDMGKGSGGMGSSGMGMDSGDMGMGMGSGDMGPGESRGAPEGTDTP